MSNIDQNTRFVNSAGDDNPFGIIDIFKPPRWIFNTTDPISNTGEDQWFFTNITTGDHFIKTQGTWTLYYNFQTGTPSPGITNVINDGAVGFFKNIIGSTAHFKGISSLSGKITFAQLANDVDLSVNLINSDVGLGNVQNIKSNFIATADPTNFDDSSFGYSIGSFWMNRSTNPSRLFICDSANLTLAVWNQIGGAGSGITSIVNLPGSAGLFRDITGGNTANFKALNSTTGKITYINNANSVDFGVNLVKSDVGLSLLENTQYVFRSALNPTVNNDASQSFVQGNLWSNYALGSVYQCRTNTVGAAVWSQIAGSFTRVDNDFILVRQNGSSHNTAFSGAGVNVLLNIGFSVYDLIQSRGSWARLNLGFGPVIIQRIVPTNGIVGNNYLITYMWTGAVSSVGAERVYNFGMNIGNGSNPNTGFIIGSGADVVFVANQFRSSTMSHSFVYTSPSATAENLYISVSNETDSTTLITEDLTVMIQQI